MPPPIVSASPSPWEEVGRSGIVSAAAALLHTRQIVFYSRPEEPPHSFGLLDNGLPGDEERSSALPELTLSAYVDLTGLRGYFPVEAEVFYNPFCAGLTHLPDGRLLVAGGDKKDDRLLGPDTGLHESERNFTPLGVRDGRRALRVFVPGARGNRRDGREAGIGPWRDVGRISGNRWYPTCALLPDGRVFIVSGYTDDMQPFNNQNPTGEIIPPGAGGAQFLPPLVEAWPHDSFPPVFALPSGEVFLFAGDSAYFLKSSFDPSMQERWKISPKTSLPERAPGKPEPAKLYPNTSTAVLLPLRLDRDNRCKGAEVLIVGGGGEDVHPQWFFMPGTNQPTYQEPACDQYFRMVVDPPAKRGPWSRGAGKKGRPQARVMPDSVLLPDGTVLVINGASRGYAGGSAGTGPALAKYAVLQPDLYDPITDTWETTLEATTIPRLYHSIALLLPDARVLISGSDHQVNERDNNYNLRIKRNYQASTFEYRMEAFTPPYLRDPAVARPLIDPQEDQRSIAYNAPFDIRLLNPEELTGELRATLVKPGAVTHGNNTGQRCIELGSVVRNPSGSLTLLAPPDSGVAPPGYYMLFVLHDGKPSEACFVRLPLLPADLDAVPRHTSMHTMALWLRADTGLLADANGVATSWADLSGNGNDVFWQGYNEHPALGRPRWQTHSVPDRDNPPLDPRPQRVPHGLNGHPVLRFSLYSLWEASDANVHGSRLQTQGDFLPGEGPYTIFAVVHVWPPGHSQSADAGRDGGWGDLLGWGDFGTETDGACVGVRFGPGLQRHPGTIDQVPRYPGTASLLHYRNSHARFVEGNPPVQVTLLAPVLLEVVYDGAATSVRVNGQNCAVNVPAGRRNTGQGPFVLGQNGPDGAFFRGDIAEVVVHRAALAEDRLETLRQYFRDRYNLW